MSDFEGPHSGPPNWWGELPGWDNLTSCNGTVQDLVLSLAGFGD